MTQENKTTLKTTPTTSKEELFFKALDATQKRTMYNLYSAVVNAESNGLLVKDIMQTFTGSDKSIYYLGVRTGQNETIKKFKAIIEGIIIW